MYAYFFTSDGRRVRVWQESVRGMPLLRLEAPVKLNQRRCRRIRRWLKQCGVHRLLNRPAHWPESEPLPPLIGTRELWITKAPETALALLAQAGISPAQARVEFCSDRFTPELADTAIALATAVRALSFSCPVSEAFCWQLQRDHGLCPGFGSGNADLSICFSPAQRTFALPLWQMRPEISDSGSHLPGGNAPRVVRRSRCWRHCGRRGASERKKSAFRRIFLDIPLYANYNILDNVAVWPFLPSQYCDRAGRGS